MIPDFLNPLWFLRAIREAAQFLLWQHARYMVTLGREYRRRAM